MSKYFLVSISGTGSGGATTIWLTSNGLNTGRPCKTSIPGADGVLTPILGNTTTANDGTPFTEKPLTPGNKGRPFEVVVDWMKADVYSDLKDLIDYVIDHATDLTITAAGTPGDFSVYAVPNSDPQPYNFDGFRSDVVKGFKMRFRTAGTV